MPASLTRASPGLAVEGQDKAGTLGAIERFLQDEARAGRRCLLVVDECQNLELTALEELRMLSNFQLGSHPLLQSLLLGQPEFRRTLAHHPGLEQLRQRIIASHHLEALDSGEVEHYVRHRLGHVGWNGRPQFEAGLLEALYRHTGGIPRRVNQVMNRLLLLAAIEESDLLSLRMLDAVVAEMTAKAGQKCTAIRRAIVPIAHLDAVEVAIAQKLEMLTVGDPRDKANGMGALVSCAQRDDVRGQVEKLVAAGARVVSGNLEAAIGPDGGAFMNPILLRTDDPWAASAVHDVEAFGPVATIMPYKDLADAIALANRGMGSLALSLFSYSPDAARDFILGAAPFHGRMLVINRDNAADSTGHGSPLPVLVHGGPGRAGGSEEMGGVRGVKHYMQRTAIQSTPAMIAAISAHYIPGGPKNFVDGHPFTKRMSELHIGDTLRTDSRTVTIADIEHFAEFTGDKFYAHMDDEAARASPIFAGRVAHGYLILSFAAGLFVWPDPGPVLANTGLENLKFLTPLYPGDAMRVELTVRSKSLKSKETGVVRWAVEIFNQKEELVATYDLLTENLP